MKETIQKTKEYLDYLEEHYNNVQEAWAILQKTGDGKPFAFLYDDAKFWALDKMVKEHDFSKLSNEEFVPYRKYFYPTENEKKEENPLFSQREIEFDSAWENHKKNNDHHWENWTKDKGMCLELCVVHNVLDWMAMGMKFNDTARDFYEKQKAKGKIEIPKWAEELMYEIFNAVYGPKK